MPLCLEIDGRAALPAIHEAADYLPPGIVQAEPGLAYDPTGIEQVGRIHLQPQAGIFSVELREIVINDAID